MKLANKSNEEIVKILNKHFSDICKKYPPLNTKNIIIKENLNDNEINLITEIETYKLIKKYSKKSLGVGDLPKTILQEFAVELAAPFTDIINCALRTRKFPEIYKRAEIIPLPKCNPPTELTDIRPISKTPIGGKMLESRIMSELQKDIKGKLDYEQYGNTKGSSTTHYLINLIDEAQKNTDIGKATTAITIDYSKAFDYVDHNILVKKIIDLGVRGSVVRLIMSFLCNRQHCTKFNGIKSEFLTITSGVPQGTVSGPQLFVILINGVKNLLVKSFKFVNDKTLAYSYYGDCTNLLQEVLNIEDRETVKDGMIINEKKCHTITFNFSAKNTPPQNLTLNNNVIEPVNKLKLLGVMISDELKWNENTSFICDKVNKRYYVLHRLKDFVFTKEELIIAWKTSLRPLAEYATPL